MTNSFDIRIIVRNGHRTVTSFSYKYAQFSAVQFIIFGVIWAKVAQRSDFSLNKVGFDL